MSTESLAAPQKPIADRVRQAQSLARDGQAADAERLFRDVLREAPENGAAATGLVRLLDTRGERAEAAAALGAWVDAAPTHANVLTASRLWEGWAQDPPPGLPKVRIALTGVGTLAPLAAHVRVACARAAMAPAVYAGEFNQWAQELLDPRSPLYRFEPDVIALLLDAETLCPLAAGDPAAAAGDIAAERARACAHVDQLLSAAESGAPRATLMLHTLSVPDHSPFGIRDPKVEGGQRERIDSANRAVAALVRERHPSTVLFDQDRIESRFGKDRIRDDRLWYMASIPQSEGFLAAMASEYVRILRPIKGLTRKCLVLDLDNTLWGGVIGEDGLNNIKIGGTAAPGNAFHDFHRALAALQARGILLAICSKNTAADAWQVFDEHPDMLLRRRHFAAARINWQDKASNIREIARDLNIGLDSLVFLDDNPAERALVRQELPAVLVPEMPADPALYVRLLRSLDVFEALTITREDVARARQYAEQQARASFEESTRSEGGDLRAYLRGLQMQLKLQPATPYTLPRIAQLLNKTNQFNMTTRRLTEPQVAALAGDAEGWCVVGVDVADRFGDSGLTGIAIAKKAPQTWTIDSFLLSCRVLGRGIEDALLTYLYEAARLAGATSLRGLFIPTSKNAPAVGFYEQQGFANQGPAPDEPGAMQWLLAIDAPRTYPDWLAVQALPGSQSQGGTE
jgi:FkbH-like protein